MEMNKPFNKNDVGEDQRAAAVTVRKWRGVVMIMALRPLLQPQGQVSVCRDVAISRFKKRLLRSAGFRYGLRPTQPSSAARNDRGTLRGCARLLAPSGIELSACC